MSERARYEIDLQRVRLREKQRRIRVWRGRALILLAVWVLCSLLFGVSVVQGDSMRPAYHEGDIVIFLRLLPGGPAYGDVVILEDGDDGREIIKRIEGLPGDEVTVDGSGRLTRNQSDVSERDMIYGSGKGEDHMTFYVPDGMYFYLGDNRPVSRDSRQEGFADAERVRGKVIASLRGR